MSCRWRRLSRTTSAARCPPAGRGHGGAAATLRPAHALPEPRRRRPHHVRERPLDAHCVVVARRDAAGIRQRGLEIVLDVDAADEGHPAVHHRELAVHAAHPVAPHRQPPRKRPEHEHRGARVREDVAEARREVACAEAVDQHLHAHAARRRARERVGDEAAGFIAAIDIGLEVHLLRRGVDRAHERREVLQAVAQEVEAVSADELHATRA
jgi:hypothetical protein